MYELPARNYFDVWACVEFEYTCLSWFDPYNKCCECGRVIVVAGVCYLLCSSKHQSLLMDWFSQLFHGSTF